jgi:hypothetical protein
VFQGALTAHKRTGYEHALDIVGSSPDEGHQDGPGIASHWFDQRSASSGNFFPELFERGSISGFQLSAQGLDSGTLVRLTCL